MFKYGLKLWSTNINYIEAAKKLYADGAYSYIELFVVPQSYTEFSEVWKGIGVPYVVHASHSGVGVNLAKKESAESNKRLIAEAQRFADRLKADKIIVHPGIDGEIKETVRQLMAINDKRILVENKPYCALDGNLFCNGASMQEIKYVIETAGVRFCLDIGHAVTAAKGFGKDWVKFLNEFLEIKPTMFHLSDGDTNETRDQHLNIGKGNFDLNLILSLLPKDAMITIETAKKSSKDLADYVLDIEELNKYRTNKSIKGLSYATD